MQVSSSAIGTGLAQVQQISSGHLNLFFLRVFFEPRKNKGTPIQRITTTRKKKFMMFTRYYRDAQTFLSNPLVGIPSSGPARINITIEGESLSQYTTGFLNLWREKRTMKLMTFKPLCQSVTAGRRKELWYREAWLESTPSPKLPSILASAARRKRESVKGIAKEG